MRRIPGPGVSASTSAGSARRLRTVSSLAAFCAPFASCRRSTSPRVRPAASRLPFTSFPVAARTILRLATPLFVASVFLASQAVAQEITARIELRVEDASGRGVPDAGVSLVRGSGATPVSTGATDASGELRLYLLPPEGDYFLLIAAPRSGAIRSGPIDLDPGRLTVLRVVLPREGEATREVIIEPEQNTVDTTDPRTATSFGSESIERVALFGRFYPGVITLAPGVTDTDMDGNPNVQGARETGLQHRLDGADVTDPASGTGGMNLNFEIIEEIEVIQAGAGAAFGRADGGFTNIITKSGGNDFEGTLRLTWRNSLLEDQGEEFDDTFVRSATVSEDFDESRVTLTAGGPVLPGRLWYFASAHRVDSTITSSFGSADLRRTQEGWTTFAKLSWQPAPDHRLSFTAVADPRRYEGLFDSFQGSQESAALWKQGSTSLQARWSWIVRPDLFFEAGFARTVSGIEIDPDSRLFHDIANPVLPYSTGGPGSARAQAIYPTRECSTDGTRAGFIPNCDPSLGTPSIYQIDLVEGGAKGPSWFAGDDTRIRGSLRADLTLTLEHGPHEHLLKAGFEGTDETVDDDSVYNPFFQNLYSPCASCTGPGGNPIPNAITGLQLLTVPYPAQNRQGADGSNYALYASDTWKPAPGLSFVLGIRLDKEYAGATGFRTFDPTEEVLRGFHIAGGLCDDAIRVATTGSGVSNGPSVCPAVGQPSSNLIYTMDLDTPRWVRRFDVNRDRRFNSGVDLIHGREVWAAHVTTQLERTKDEFDIENRNWSPRLGAAWDPWSDGRTKLFTTWGRYYDRLFLAVAAHETAPVFANFTFEPDPFTHQFTPGQLSNSAPAFSAQQVDRDLRTPYTDVFTLGVEREVAPEWSVRAAYVQRLAWDLLDDSDVNHILCREFNETLGIEPTTVCPGPVLPNGKTPLDEDRFGTFGTGQPNGLEDLYALNRSFNQVLRVENSGSAKYRGVTVEAIRRFWRGWQMALSYTYSRAEGEGLSFTSLSGNDPAGAGPEVTALDFDQHHRVVLYGTVALPRRTDLGWVVRWESGTPYAVTQTLLDEDNFGNITVRTVYPTGERNDQRNGGVWSVDARVAKHLTLGRMAASIELAVRNLLDEDDTAISGFDPSSASGPALAPGPGGLTVPGRTWEAGVVFSY